MTHHSAQSSADLTAALAWQSPVNPWIIALTVMLATFMEVLDVSVANVALPQIAGNLSAGVDESTWVLTSYLVSNAIVLPLSGWFSALLGRKRFYLLCVTLFIGSSLLCGLAPNLTMLVFFRILQGLGGGALQPVSQAILFESFPRGKQGMAMAVFGMGVVFAPIVGPTLGGWITDNYSWRWIFFINIPIGLLSIVLTSALVHDPPYLIRKHWGQTRVDYIGIGLISIGLGCLQIVLDKGEREDWFESRFICALSLMCAVSLVGAVFWEWFHRDPVVDIHLLKNRNFSVATLLMYMLGVMLFGSLVLLPIFLQTLMGYTAYLSGLVLSPGGVVILFVMPLVGWLISRMQARILIIFGIVVSAFSMFQMANFDLQIDFRSAVIARIVQGFGLGFLFVPINTVAFSFISKEKTNAAAGIINLARNIGGSTGIAIVATLLARRSQFHQNVLSAHMTPLDETFSQAFQQAQQYLIRQGADAATAATKAYALLYAQLQRQAGMLSFVDCFWLLAVLFLLIIPLVFLIRKSPAQREPAA
jgi:MFS transporter, DHA2 family, multidrug resistance protein